MQLSSTYLDVERHDFKTKFKAKDDVLLTGAGHKQHNRKGPPSKSTLWTVGKTSMGCFERAAMLNISIDYSTTTLKMRKKDSEIEKPEAVH